MSYAERHSVTVTTAADGTATAYTNAHLTGRVVTVVYTADGSAPYDNTVDATITGEQSGVTIFVKANITASFTHSPRQATHLNTDASALLYAAGGATVGGDVFVANERIKIVLAQGGDTKTGLWKFIVA